MASVILGDWTHRRGDPGGARAVAAEIDRPRPTIAWSWRPDHRGRVDQVRVGGGLVVVATMTPRDPGAPGWEHAVVYVVDAATGEEVARRVLPDPVPVAAMVIDSTGLHIVATRKNEPIYWYALDTPDLAARQRKVVSIADGLRHDDVLDAWATPDGGLWLELDVTPEGEAMRAQSYAYADPSGCPMVARLRDEYAVTDCQGLAHDACAGERDLFVPREGRWGGPGDCSPPALARLDPLPAGEGDGGAWARASVVGPRARIHALGGDGIVYAVTAAEDPAKPDRLRVEAFAVDRASGVVRWRAQDDRVSVTAQIGDAARIARRPNGELLFQNLDADDVPCTPLLCAGPDGHLDAILLGARGRYVLDAALGELVLAHRENKDGRVEVGGFAIDREGRLLGRRAVARWTMDVGDLGGGTTVYAGAGLVILRGTRAICALRL